MQNTHFIVEKWVDPMRVKLVGEIVERYGVGYVLRFWRGSSSQEGKEEKLKRVQSFPRVFDCGSFHRVVNLHLRQSE
jgi:hypothetical protein